MAIQPHITVYSDGSFVLRDAIAPRATPGMFAVPTNGANSMQPPTITVTTTTVANPPPPTVTRANAPGWLFNPPGSVWNQQAAPYHSGPKPEWNVAGADAQSGLDAAVWKFQN